MAYGGRCLATAMVFSFARVGRTMIEKGTATRIMKRSWHAFQIDYMTCFTQYEYKWLWIWTSYVQQWAYSAKTSTNNIRFLVVLLLLLLLLLLFHY
jgi:hypothetical protein